MKDWIKKKSSSARKLNYDDRLVYEAMFLVHDYLHLWSYKMIQAHFPKIGFGIRPITKKNIEDFVFCHLVTEAAAVVGLDYWVLCQRGINEYCPLGSKSGPLTVSYAEKNIDEFRRFNPSFKVMKKDFFSKIAKFYCTGQFYGFDVHDVKRSPLLSEWLEHEIYYGDTQRVYTRAFLSLMASEDIPYDKKGLGKRVSTQGSWKSQLLEVIGDLLWEKVLEDQLHPCSRVRVKNGWSAARPRYNHWPYVNLNTCTEDEFYEGLDNMEAGDLSKEDPGRHFVTQFVSRHKYSSFSEDEVELILRGFENKNYESIVYVCQGKKRLSLHRDEPRSLLMLG
ncbi:MAG: hypothetical protein AAF202_09770 [Pseudomonadota bacterium]